ncbi:MAG: hypothetical protein H5U20_04860 [Rhodobacteraceae bacterium]|nr:hypothetical protein [Paracoccaceae bacterium]
MAEAPLTPERADPRGLIFESYRIEGIGAAECRSILVDWALGLPEGVAPRAAMRVLLAEYGVPGHPMTALLSEGLSAAAPPPGRRGGRRGRARG